MKTEIRLVSSLKENPRNPRKISSEKFEALVKSIREFPKMLELRPLVIFAEGVVLGGNMRLKAIKELGIKEVPVVYAEGLTKDELKRFVMVDNMSFGQWDWDMISADFDVADLMDYGFDEYELGFDPFPSEDKDEKTPNLTDNPISKPGDIYQLGRHTLMCGDSTNLEQVKLLMGGVQADMVFTDPPYNVDYSGRGKNTSNKIQNDNMSEGDFRQFLNKVFECYKAISSKSCPWYVCYASRTHREFEDAINQALYTVTNQIIWVKAVASMGWGNYRWKHEPILYCKPNQGSAKFYGDRKQYTTWEHKPTEEELLRVVRDLILEEETQDDHTVWRLGRDSHYDHPTQKPVQLITKALINSSKPEDTVVDLFGGSGSTLIACEKTGRTCKTMELDCKYVDVIVQRYVNYTENENITRNGEKIVWDKED